MTNKKITTKEWSLIKGKINSIFSRSELRRSIIQEAVISHSDESRPRVKTWFKCALCGKPEAKSYAEVDHITPKIRISETFDTMNLDDYIDRVWCNPSNLQVVCKPCHRLKSTEENKLRRKYRRSKNGNRSKKN